MEEVIGNESNHSPGQCDTVLRTFADNYIEKPFKTENIIVRVEEELKKVELKSEEKKKILLVDDMGVIIHMMQSHLSDLGYDVNFAKDGEEGIRKYRTLRTDLMIADLMLPKVHGFEVCHQVKSDSQTKDTKIIVVSSKNKKEDVLKCFEIGMDDYMIKPFSMLEPEGRIKSLFDDSRRCKTELIMKKVLIADDERALRVLIAGTLEISNFKVLEASNGTDAIKIIEQDRPDLVILDVMMPDMTGYEVCKYIKFNKIFSETKVIILTSKGLMKDVMAAKDARADCYMSKPFSPAELLTTVESMLGVQGG